MNELLNKAIDKANWRRLKRASHYTPSAAQAEANDRWKRLSAYGGSYSHSARRRVAEEDRLLAAERRAAAEKRFNDEMAHQREKEKIVLQGKRDIALEKEKGAWQKDVAFTNKLATDAMHNDKSTEYLLKKDALDAAREERQHTRALELAREQAKSAAAADQAKRDHELRIEQEKTHRELLNGDDKRAEHFKRGKEFFDMAKRAESGNISPYDLEKLDRKIDQDDENYDTPEKKAKAKAAYRLKLSDPAFVKALMEEYKKEMAAAGYTL